MTSPFSARQQSISGQHAKTALSVPSPPPPSWQPAMAVPEASWGLEQPLMTRAQSQRWPAKLGAKPPLFGQRLPHSISP
eukprot:1888898-Rhodomonas_salina.1